MEFLNFSTPNFENLILKLLFLSFSGAVIRQALVMTGQRWANTFHHLGSYILLPNIALIITTVIKNDIALSLGMIGALSIVRFRNPVKSPFELVVFFSLLTLGIVASVSGKLSLLLFIFIILILFSIHFFHKIAKKFKKDIYQFSFGEGNLVYTLEVNSKKKLDDLEKNKSVIEIFEDNENNNFFYRFAFNSKEELQKYKKSIEDREFILNIKSDFQA
tara:strand:- start:58 stop:711 length:654 start_codon:yes stop_codon:yes gene_type:complete